MDPRDFEPNCGLWLFSSSRGTRYSQYRGNPGKAWKNPVAGLTRVLLISKNPLEFGVLPDAGWDFCIEDWHP